eukprot:CAMPEP_0204286820 /NCGR_PEP_ID=MMETSP0468-20130131/53493_1 /ASSEMBLY_ACC=CAM_ASM_000383 /TAXON_ID=2969 /ORGANISM="Oxyrrhis marina" /LENGTH=165 /DNA_ID=CAMNT_0051264751 /DNA_START=85 /DNA_END=583 /DNA_ORIENTATION=+
MGGGQASPQDQPTIRISLTRPVASVAATTGPGLHGENTTPPHVIMLMDWHRDSVFLSHCSPSLIDGFPGAAAPNSCRAQSSTKAWWSAEPAPPTQAASRAATSPWSSSAAAFSRPNPTTSPASLFAAPAKTALSGRNSTRSTAAPDPVRIAALRPSLACIYGLSM